MINQQRAAGEMDDEQSESEYQGEGEDMDDDGETSQMSPTQESPDRESDLEHTKTENLRNFVHQVQPAGSMNNSQLEKSSNFAGVDHR